MAEKSLLFDLDGTLWDSRPWFAQILARFSGEVPARFEARLAAETNIVQLARECHLTPARLAREAGGCSEELCLYDGTIETLATLTDLETPMGVVTNLPGWLVNTLIERTGLVDYFGVVITPNPYRGIRVKPSPSGINLALRYLRPKPGTTTWYIGDDTVDAGAALAAGVQFAWASYGYEAEPPAGTDRELAQISDVLGL